MAQAFAPFGSTVTFVHADARILPREDADAGAIVTSVLEDESVRILNRAQITNVWHRDGEFHVVATTPESSAIVVSDRLLVATGRAPNVDGLRLDLAGVEYTRAGITVDARMRTSNARVFAIGDVASALKFTHVADAQARLAVANTLFFGIGGGSHRPELIPRVTYTAPEVAHVGVTLDEATARGQQCDVVRVELSANDRSILEGDSAGFLNVCLAKESDRIPGATLVAAHAGEMIGELGVAITNGIGLGGAGKTVHAYPTQSEVFRKATDVWRRGKLTPTAGKALRWWFKLFSAR